MNIYISELPDGGLLVQQFVRVGAGQNLVLQFYCVEDLELCSQLRLLAELGLPTDVTTHPGDCAVGVGHFASSHHTLRQTDLIYFDTPPHYEPPLFHSPQWDYRKSVVQGGRFLTAHPLHIPDRGLATKLTQCSYRSFDIHLEYTGQDNLYNKDDCHILSSHIPLLRDILSKTFKLFEPSAPSPYTMRVGSQIMSQGTATLKPSVSMTSLLHQLASEFRNSIRWEHVSNS